MHAQTHKHTNEICTQWHRLVFETHTPGAPNLPEDTLLFMCTPALCEQHKDSQYTHI